MAPWLSSDLLAELQPLVLQWAWQLKAPRTADAKLEAEEKEVSAKACEDGGKAVRASTDVGRKAAGRLAHRFSAGQCTTDMSRELLGTCGPGCWTLLCTSMLPTVSCTGPDMALELENKPAPQSRNNPIAPEVGIAKPIHVG